MIAEPCPTTRTATWSETDWAVAERIIETLRSARLRQHDVRLNVSYVGGQVAVYRVRNEELLRKRH